MRREQEAFRKTWSERKHGFSAEPVPVSAYVGSSKNLKDLKDAIASRRACALGRGGISL